MLAFCICAVWLTVHESQLEIELTRHKPGGDWKQNIKPMGRKCYWYYVSFKDIAGSTGGASLFLFYSSL